ncbi:FAD-dependent monooxygenase cctM [Pseudocercospora fuligena]|uniref:FAD-dependent monooxygenase cctM n=1 Tax=Pseudocercospora fuligena TaxID=685502 RepID=A0A8H6RUI3_9PEZI|nr:FAD-dependent monooxygenase cctM [Pseudocercospora fuligena]
MKEIYVDPSIDAVNEPIPYFDPSTGDIIRRIETPFINRVSRLKIRKFLTEGQDLNIRFSKRLTGITVTDEHAQVTFEDGTKYTGSMAIGADGSHSVVRTFLLGPEAAKIERIDHTMINFPASGYTPEQIQLLRSFHPITQLAHSQQFGSALVATLDAEKGMFQNYTSWWGPPYAEDLQDRTVRLKFYKERLSHFCEPFKTGASVVNEGTEIPVFAGAQWAPPKEGWDNHGGRVTLVGDAAHSMLPHRGQGFNNAVKDASDVVDAIVAVRDGKMTLKEAITAYEEEMRPRGAEEVRLSLLQAESSRNGNIMESPMFKTGHQKVT